LDEEDAIGERNAVRTLMNEANTDVEVFKKLHADVLRDWTDEEKRTIGHVTLSPPITALKVVLLRTEQLLRSTLSLISKLTFIGNAIDLGSIPVDKLTAWMYPHHTNPSSFEYPGDRLLCFFGAVSDKEMYQPNSKTVDKDNKVVIMVLKNGGTTDLTVDRSNIIRAFTRTYFDGKPGVMSREIAVLPRSSKADPFSAKCDLVSVVVDGKGRVCSLLTGGDGDTHVSDCTYRESPPSRGWNTMVFMPISVCCLFGFAKYVCCACLCLFSFYLIFLQS